MDSNRKTPEDQGKNIKLSYYMLIIIFFVTLIDESVDSVLIESIIPLSAQYSWLTNAFIVLSLPFALILGGWSDFHCRRKTLIFALSCILISIIMMFYFHKFSRNWIAFTSLAIKAIGGNAIPIALASIIDVMPQKKLKSSLAITICAYSLGSWLPIYLRPHLASLNLSISIGTLFILISVILWFKNYEFDGIKLTKNKPNLRQFPFYIRKDVVEIFVFIFTPLVCFFYFGFILNEISFYQILLRGELLLKDNYYSFAAIALGGGYYIGTAILFILEKKDFTDEFCIKLGVLISFVSISFITILNFIQFKFDFFYGVLLAAFSLGFALITPSIFAFFSATREDGEYGKIYGLLDSTDALAFLVTAGYIYKSKNVSYERVSLLSLILFFISSIIILAFVKIIKVSNAKTPRN